MGIVAPIPKGAFNLCRYTSDRIAVAAGAGKHSSFQMEEYIRSYEYLVRNQVRAAYRKSLVVQGVKCVL